MAKVSLLTAIGLAHLVASVAAATLAPSPQDQTTTLLRPEQNAPGQASKLVDSSFPSFGIQGSSFPAFTGNASHPNIFSRNLIHQIEERTGGPLVVRVGGTNTDYSNFNPDQTGSVEPPQEGDGIGQRFIFGPSFYEGFQNWPGTRWIYTVPFAKQNKTLSYDQGKAAVDNIGLTNLEALEIGNEVDLYVNQGVRPAGWGPQDYATQFLNYSAWLTNALGLPDGPLYETITLSSANSFNWTVESVFEGGIADSNRVKSVSLHHYEYTNTTTGLQATLMNHTFVKQGVDTYKNDIQYLQNSHPKIQVVFGESGRYSSTMSSVDDSEGIFGAALWTVDYLLYLMSLNVARVNMQLSKVFGYVAWHPVSFDGIQPEVRSPYYGHLFVAEFIGSSKAFRVSEVATDDDLLAVYAGYEHDALKRIAVINYDVWEKGSNTQRPKRTFKIKVPSGIGHATVQTLTSPQGTSANSTFYWAGKTWTYANNGIGKEVLGQKGSETVLASSGYIEVDVGASEAVMVHFKES